jgi:hypothetical protein
MHAYIIWIAALAYALHVVEEYTFNWKAWALAVLKLPVNWTHFAIVNGVVAMLGISCASVGWSLPAFALSLPALMLINATAQHVRPFVVGKGRRFSPGLGTSVLLFYPIGIWAYWGAYADGVLTVWVAVLSFVLGGIELAMPISMLVLRSRPYFKQE